MTHSGGSVESSIDIPAHTAILVGQNVFYGPCSKASCPPTWCSASFERVRALELFSHSTESLSLIGMRCVTSYISSPRRNVR